MNSLTTLTLIFSLVITFFASYLFTNAAEYIQARKHLTSSFIGSILSPLFTSIPEAIIFLIAILFYKETAGEEIGIGTLIGQPFMASTISYTLVLLSVILGYKAKRRSSTNLQIQSTLALPFAIITFLFPLIIIPSILDVPFIHEILAILLITTYILFGISTYRKAAPETIEEVILHLNFIMKPDAAALTQLIISSITLYLGGNLMISSISNLSRDLSINPLSFSIIIIPLGTAIPETMTAIIWSFKGKDTLAISSLVGEKILYSTIYPAIGILTTTWILNYLAYTSILITTAVSLILWQFTRRGYLPKPVLAAGLPMFVLFIILLYIS
ncbi:MAG: sodium:calcium antiporter [Candidatus Parvarchaeota archaeon]